MFQKVLLLQILNPRYHTNGSDGVFFPLKLHKPSLQLSEPLLNISIFQDREVLSIQKPFWATKLQNPSTIPRKANMVRFSAAHCWYWFCPIYFSFCCDKHHGQKQLEKQGVCLAYSLYSSSSAEAKAGTQDKNWSRAHEGMLLYWLAQLPFWYSLGPLAHG